MPKQKKFTVHKKVREDGRRNGKSWKQHPKGFSATLRRLVTVARPLGGTKVDSK